MTMGQLCIWTPSSLSSVMESSLRPTTFQDRKLSILQTLSKDDHLSNVNTLLVDTFHIQTRGQFSKTDISSLTSKRGSPVLDGHLLCEHRSKKDIFYVERSLSYL